MSIQGGEACLQPSKGRSAESMTKLSRSCTCRCRSWKASLSTPLPYELATWPSEPSAALVSAMPLLLAYLLWHHVVPSCQASYAAPLLLAFEAELA